MALTWNLPFYAPKQFLTADFDLPDGLSATAPATFCCPVHGYSRHRRQQVKFLSEHLFLSLRDNPSLPGYDVPPKFGYQLSHETEEEKRRAFPRICHG